MRVIGGKWKSRKINEHFKLSHNKVIRPTSDRVKENIFNILENLDIDNKIFGSKVLDVFCGTGAMGIESISRGATFCHFIDKSLISRQITLQNIHNLSCEKETQFSLKNVLDIGFCNHDTADVIFLDPPYKKNIAEVSILRLSKFGWIDDNTLIILEKGKDECFKSGFKLIDKRIYGNTEILFLKFLDNFDKVIYFNKKKY